MTSEKDHVDDVYSRVDYRRIVAWPRRIQREAPFLLRSLAQAPEASLLDLGCGTGEHSRFFFQQGYRVMGVDRSPAMLAKARESERPPRLAFLEADLRQLEGEVTGSFGVAISLGNTLVHLTELDELSGFLSTLSSLLLSGGVFLFQILNYERIFNQQIRYLPLNFREDQGERIIFLRLMDLRPERRVRFCPSTLRFDPEGEPHLEVVKSKVVELRGWIRQDLLPLLEEAGMPVVLLGGDMEGGSFDPQSSSDLVVLCRKA